MDNFSDPYRLAFVMVRFLASILAMRTRLSGYGRTLAAAAFSLALVVGGTTVGAHANDPGAVAPMDTSRLPIYERTDSSIDRLQVVWRHAEGTEHVHAQLRTLNGDVLDTYIASAPAWGWGNATFYELPAATEYMVYLRSEWPDGTYSGWSQGYRISTALPKHPHFEGSEHSATRIVIKWWNEAGAHRYRLRWRVGTDGPVKVVEVARAARAFHTTHLVQGLPPGADIYFDVESIAANGRSLPPRELTAYSTLYWLPPVPAHVQAKDVSVTSALLTFEAIRRYPMSAAEEGYPRWYRLYATSVLTGKTLVHDVGDGQQLFFERIRGLNANDTYRVSVAAGTFHKEFGPKSEPITIRTLPLKAVAGLKFVKSAASTVDLAWQGQEGAVRHRVYYRVGGRGSMHSVDVVGTTARLRSLPSGTSHTVGVAALSGNGTATAMTPQLIVKTTGPIAPRSLRHRKVTKTAAKITWIRSPGAVKYKIVYVTGKAKAKTVTKKSAGSVSLKKLKKNSSYKVTVTAINRTGVESTPSSVKIRTKKK